MDSIRDGFVASSSALRHNFEDPTELRMQLNVAHEEIATLREQQTAYAQQM